MTFLEEFFKSWKPSYSLDYKIRRELGVNNSINLQSDNMLIIMDLYLAKRNEEKKKKTTWNTEKLL